MRPRVFPAEDRARSRGRLQLPVASMRPRVFPAEDYDATNISFKSSAASMRPRVFPAEDVRCAASACRGLHGASMRPRVFPAEDMSCRSPVSAPSHRFNEAAGIPRGRRDAMRLYELPAGRFNEAAGIPRGRRRLRVQAIGQPLLASMRPRVFPAEDSNHAPGCSTVGARFNEAAGIPRGRLPATFDDWLADVKLQ